MASMPLSIYKYEFRFSSIFTTVLRYLLIFSTMQWNLDLTKCQGTDLVRYVGVLFHTFDITGLKNIVRYTGSSLYRGSLNRGSTVLQFWALPKVEI